MHKLLWLILFFRIGRSLAPYVLGLIGGILFLGLIGTTSSPGIALLASIGVTGGLIQGLKSWLADDAHRPVHPPRRNRYRNPSRGRFNGRL